MIVYKAFDKGLKCRGYQFSKDKINVTKEANCVRNGFHAAENPLDCLTYYPNWNKSEYWICEASGDIDEDGRDSKISCTSLRLLFCLDVENFVIEALSYMMKHPKRKENNYVDINESRDKTSLPFKIVRGINPVAKGDIDTWLGFAKEDAYGNIVEISLLYIDGINYMPNVWYVYNEVFNKGGEDDE